MVQIGSFYWRLKNYGFVRTLKFIFLHHFLQKFGLLSVQYETKDEEALLHELAQVLGLTYQKVFQIREFSREFLIVAAAEAKSRGIEIKRDVAGLNGPLMRLTVIGTTVYRFRPDHYIETGTQHGISAEFVHRLSLEYELQTRVISIDVDHDQTNIINSGYVHEVLKAPIAKSFLALLRIVALESVRVVFHHDSDHTYEHMSWELKTAAKLLGPIAIVCDDIEQHRAFSDFAKNFCGASYSFGVFGQSTCGLSLKCDPDGT